MFDRPQLVSQADGQEMSQNYITISLDRQKPAKTAGF